MKYFYIGLLLLSFGILSFQANGQDYTIIEDQAKLPILTPSFAERKTLKIRLKNGLEAILVSDPLADKSSAALGVRTGSWEDPEEYPGIAHFLEHMLFLGTKKYPNESEYQRFIAEHNGITNAFTANDLTSFIFSVNNEAFPEALDRFANFFKEPLFNPSGVSRELHAIDQEYAKNLDNDDIRELFVIKALSNPNHPNNHFNIGNSSTLSNVSQSTLIKWYKEHYSANLMRLVVYSSLPLDKLASFVVEDFGGIPNIEKKPFKTNVSADNDLMVGKMVYIEPIKDIRTLTLIWNLPSKFADMVSTKPEALVCYVLGHEGEKSLLAELKRQKLAESLKCGGIRIGPGLMSFYIDIELTDEGVAQHELVITLSFQAIANLRKKGVSQNLYDELKRMETIRYQYQTREEAFDEAMCDAQKIFDEPIATYPEQTNIIQTFDPAAVKELLNFLTPERSRFFLVAPYTLTQVKPDQTEKWLGIQYAIKTIPEARMDTWSHVEPFDKIDIPAPNTFIPSKLNLYSSTQPISENPLAIPHPQLILDNEMGKIFFAQDQRYRVPQIYWYFEIKTPRIKAGNPNKVVLGDLWVRYLTENLNMYSYDAMMAGLDYNLQRTDNGISITLKGYNEKAHILFDQILKHIKEFKLNEQNFELYKESLYRDYQNFAKETPVKQAANVLKSIIYKNFTTEKQKAAAIREITFEDFREYVDILFEQIYIQGLLYGNMTEEQARTISNKLIDTLQAQPYSVEKQPKTEILILPGNEGPFYIENTISTQGNAVLLAIEHAPYTFKARAAQQILMQAMSEPFFTALRTKQQTGYLVYNTDEELERQMFDLFLVQSNTHEVRDLLARFELFIEGYLQELNHTEFTEEAFNNIRKALLEELVKGPQNIERMGDLLKTLAFKYDADFNWISKRIEALKTITYDEFLKESQEFLGKGNKRRLAVMMKGIIPEENVFDYQRIDNAQQIRRMGAFVGN